jgi:rhodanese-related sulfurtransferase
MEEISPHELKARFDRGDRPVLLDVRQDWETKLARLDSAVHIPIEEIEFRTEELNPDDEIVVYCHQGVRSAAVAAYLRQQGFAKAVNLTGGLDLWARAIDPAMRRY